MHRKLRSSEEEAPELDLEASLNETLNPKPWELRLLAIYAQRTAHWNPSDLIEAAAPPAKATVQGLGLRGSGFKDLGV